MTAEVTEPVPRDRPAANDHQAAAKPLDGSSLAEPCFVVLVTTPAGKTRRRAFLSLHAATAAVQRARRRGEPAYIVVPDHVGIDVTP